MKHLETVVRERNEAYYKLEVGESAERPGQLVTNLLGKLLVFRKYFILTKFKKVISSKKIFPCLFALYVFI